MFRNFCGLASNISVHDRVLSNGAPARESRLAFSGFSALNPKTLNPKHKHETGHSWLETLRRLEAEPSTSKPKPETRTQNLNPEPRNFDRQRWARWRLLLPVFLSHSLCRTHTHTHTRKHTYLLHTHTQIHSSLTHTNSLRAATVGGGQQN